MKLALLLSLIIGFTFSGFSQPKESAQNYVNAYSELDQMLKGTTPLSFKRAVFLTENAYLDNKLDYNYFVGQVNELVQFCKQIKGESQLEYKYKDQDQILLSFAIYRVMKENMVFESPYKSLNLQKKPYEYDMEDFWGEKDWTKMFVNKLLNTSAGNCHSLPALYKILADELRIKAWLAVAPSHTYIKQWSEKTGWYNTELTTGHFPMDADIKWNNYISLESIASGVYMDTLSSKETIAYVVTDLANGYVRKFGYEDTTQPLKWLEESLIYYPDNINALILRAELLKKNYEHAMSAAGIKDFLKSQKLPSFGDRLKELERSYEGIHKLGYRKMPKEMYLNWLFKIQNDSSRKPYTFSAPQPFKKYNYNVTTTTGGASQNSEFYDIDEIVTIGTVRLNTIIGKIQEFINPKPDELPDGLVSRMYDPALGRWWSIDPLGEKYFNMSPYTAMANNPIRYNDPTGMEFTDAAMAWVNRLISSINDKQQYNNDRIAAKQEKLEGDVSDKKANRLNRQIARLQQNNTDLEGVRGEIATMSASNQVYNVVERDLNENGPVQGMGTNIARTSFNGQTGAVDIEISRGNGLAQFGHELKHGYQFEIGQISLGSGEGRRFMLDQHDEVEAYQREALLGGHPPGARGISSLPERYQGLPTGPVDVTNHPNVLGAQYGSDLQAIQLRLRNIAQFYNQAFRVNGTTYRP